MKYLKLLALVLLAWAIVYTGGAVLSLRSASQDASSAAVALLKRNALPGFLRPSVYSYTDNGKVFTTTDAGLAAYQSSEAQKSIVDLVADQHSGGYLLYAWCMKFLPWLALLLTLWLLNIAAGIKRLADALE